MPQNIALKLPCNFSKEIEKFVFEGNIEKAMCESLRIVMSCVFDVSII